MVINTIRYAFATSISIIPSAGFMVCPLVSGMWDKDSSMDGQPKFFLTTYIRYNVRFKRLTVDI